MCRPLTYKVFLSLRCILLKQFTSFKLVRVRILFPSPLSFYNLILRASLLIWLPREEKKWGKKNRSEGDTALERTGNKGTDLREARGLQQ